MSDHIKTVDARDPTKVMISRGALRELIRYARHSQSLCEGSEVPTFAKVFRAEDAELVDHLESLLD